MGFSGPLGRSCHCIPLSPINLQIPVGPSTHSATWGFHFPIFSWDQKGTGFSDDLESVFHGVRLKEVFHWGPSLPLRIWNLRGHSLPRASVPSSGPSSDPSSSWSEGALFACPPAGRSPGQNSELLRLSQAFSQQRRQVLLPRSHLLVGLKNSVSFLPCSFSVCLVSTLS